MFRNVCTTRFANFAMSIFVAAFAAVAITLSPGAHAQSKSREVSIGLQAAITSMDPHFHNLGPNNAL